MTTDTSEAWPETIRINKARDALTIQFVDGASHTFSAEFLRVMSPSAEVQGHSPDQRKTVPGKRLILISDVQPVGNYAVKIVFSDGHSTGIYAWSYFATLGVEHESRWQGYLAELAAKGLTRG